MLTVEDVFDKQGFFKVDPEHHHYIASNGESIDYYTLYEPFYYGSTDLGKQIANTIYVPYIETGEDNRNTDNVNIEFHVQVRNYILEHASEIHPLSDIVKYYFSGGISSFTRGNYTDIYMWRHDNRSFRTIEEITLDKKCN